MNELFVLSLAMVMAFVFRWAFRALPLENWQIIAAMPRDKLGTGEWRGENLTYYGFFTAGAYLFAVSTVFILLGAISVSAAAIFLIVFIVLGFCIPFSSLIARLVEKIKHTFTIGGASFAGILLVPWIAMIADEGMIRWSGMRVPAMPVPGCIFCGILFRGGHGKACMYQFRVLLRKTAERLPGAGAAPV